jgi:hypothetical protein
MKNNSQKQSHVNRFSDFISIFTQLHELKGYLVNGTDNVKLVDTFSKVVLDIKDNMDSAFNTIIDSKKMNDRNTWQIWKERFKEEVK